MKIYTVRDAKVEAYLQPFFAVNDSVALRMMVDTANDNGTLFNKHPADYEIFYIGEYYENSGEIIPADHRSLGKVIDLLRSPNEG